MQQPTRGWESGGSQGGSRFSQREVQWQPRSTKLPTETRPGRPLGPLERRACRACATRATLLFRGRARPSIARSKAVAWKGS